MHVAKGAGMIAEPLGKMLPRTSEHAKDGEYECGGTGKPDPPGDPDAWWVGGAADGQVRHEGIELAVRPSCGRGFESLLELIRRKPTLDRRTV